MARTITSKSVALTALTSSPYNVLLSSDVVLYNFTGTFALTGNLTIAASGTAIEGMVVVLSFADAITIGANTLTVFGTTITAKIALQQFIVIAIYMGGEWVNRVVLNFAAAGSISNAMFGTDVYDDSTIENDATVGLRVKDAGITAAKLGADAVTTVKILDANVTLAKVVGVTRGSILVGDVSGRPAELVAKTSAQLLIGDGTDLVSVPITGDIAVTAGGVVSLAAACVGTTEIANDAVTAVKIPAAAGLEVSKLEALTATRVAITDASGFLSISVTTPTELAYNNTVTPGVATANKTLVLGASKDIDSMDITTTFKIGGVAVTKTAAQINYNENAVSTYATDSNLVEASDVHLVDTSAADVIITLPLLSVAKEKIHTFKKTSALNTMTITASGADSINDKSLADVASVAVTGAEYFSKIAMSVSKWDEIAV